MSRSSNFVSKPIRRAIYERDRFSCAYCGKDLSSAGHRDITLDHIIAEALGGDVKDPQNLITACLHCNSSKRAEPLLSWHSRKEEEKNLLPLVEIKRQIKNRKRRILRVSLAA